MMLTYDILTAAFERFYIRELILDRLRYPNKPGLIYGDRATLDDVRRAYTLRGRP